MCSSDLPLLEKYRLPATFYIITGGLEEGTPMWWDQAIAMLATTNVQSLDPRAVGLSELPYELSLHRHARRASCITILNALWERNPTAIAQCLEQMRKVLRQIGRAHVELQSRMYLVCRLLLEKKKMSIL